MCSNTIIRDNNGSCSLQEEGTTQVEIVANNIALEPRLLRRRTSDRIEEITSAQQFPVAKLARLVFRTLGICCREIN